MQKISPPKNAKVVRYFPPAGNLPDPRLTLRRKPAIHWPLPLLIEVKRSPFARLFF